MSIRFLVDESTGKEVAAYLRRHGYDVAPLRTRQRIARCVKDGAVVVVGQQIG